MIADNDLLSSSRCSDLVVRADNDNLLDSCTDCGDVARDDIVDQVRRSGKLMQKKNPCILEIFVTNIRQCVSRSSSKKNLTLYT